MTQNDATSLFGYGCSCCLVDLYEPEANRLKTSLLADADFVFKYSCKEELRYCEILRFGKRITIKVEAVLDDLQEAADAVLLEALGGKDYALNGYDAIAKYHDLDPNNDESVIFDILNECEGWFSGIYTKYHEAMVEIDDCDFDALLDMVSRLEQEVVKSAHTCYVDMLDCAKESIAASEEQGSAFRFAGDRPVVRGGSLSD